MVRPENYSEDRDLYEVCLSSIQPGASAWYSFLVVDAAEL